MYDYHLPAGAAGAAGAAALSLSVLSSFLAPNPPKRDGAAGVVEAGGVLEDAGASGFLPNNPAPAPKTEPPVEAADLNTNLDDLSRSLMQMIDSVNTLSGDSDGGSGDDGNSKGDAPLEQIAQILSSHLEGLQWIDGAVREVDSKVTDVERLVRDASSNGSRSGSTTSSMTGSVNGSMGMSRSRGFGVR